LRPFSVLLASAIALAASASPAAGAAFPCSQDTVLTPLGADTRAGTVLFAAAGETGGEGSWLVEVRAGGDAIEARSYPRPAGARAFAGSIGPGPVFAVRDCGPACFQAVRWAAGSWEPLGEPLAAPVVSTVHATYDLAGAPWLVLHGIGNGGGEAADARPPVRAWAFRLAGREWAAQGSLPVLAPGSNAALPAADGDRAVVSGTARFAAGGEPDAWVRGLPRLPPERQGEVMPAGGGTGAPAGGGGTGGAGSPGGGPPAGPGASGAAAVYLDADNLVYLSRDQGASWARSEWTPWGVQRARVWRPGRDYTVDVPLGDRRGPFLLAWFDRRDRAEERLLLTAWTPDDGWRALAELPAEVVTLDGQRLNYNLLLAPRPGAWLLATGCVFTRTGPGLVLRTWDDAGGLSAPRFVELRPADEAR
jgi:hypothetical protein